MTTIAPLRWSGPHDTRKGRILPVETPTTTKKDQQDGAAASEEEQALDTAIGAILDSYAVGDVNRNKAIEELAKLITPLRGEAPKRKPRRPLHAT